LIEKAGKSLAASKTRETNRADSLGKLMKNATAHNDQRSMIVPRPSFQMRMVSPDARLATSPGRRPAPPSSSAKALGQPSAL
jgi:hypothetical protein